MSDTFTETPERRGYAADGDKDRRDGLALRAGKSRDGPAPAGSLEQHYRFHDLKTLGIVGTWPTLYDWIAKRGFPPGMKLGPKFRVWPASEVHAWLEAQQIKAA